MTCVYPTKLKKYFKKIGNESSKKVTINYVCNHLEYKYSSLPTIQYSDTSCNN